MQNRLDTVNDNEIYDPDRPTGGGLAVRCQYPTPDGVLAPRLWKDRLYAFGGGNARPDTFPNNEIYDIDGDAWSAGRPMTVGRAWNRRGRT